MIACVRCFYLEEALLASQVLASITHRTGAGV
jgi:hypothetical protein